MLASISDTGLYRDLLAIGDTAGMLGVLGAVAAFIAAVAARSARRGYRPSYGEWTAYGAAFAAVFGVIVELLDRV